MKLLIFYFEQTSGSKHLHEVGNIKAIFAYKQNTYYMSLYVLLSNLINSDGVMFQYFFLKEVATTFEGKRLKSGVLPTMIDLKLHQLPCYIA